MLQAKYPDLAFHFGVQVSTGATGSNGGDTTDVRDALQRIHINYMVDNSLENIITPQILRQYNEIFQFLMQIKYGLWALENLHFPASIKKRASYESFGLVDYKFKRLTLIRNWLLYLANCINSHLMIHVLQGHGEWLDEHIGNVTDLNEIIAVHRQYVDTVHEQCFQATKDGVFRAIILHMLSLIVVVRAEWEILAAEISGVGGGDELDSAEQPDIDWIESTYLNLHSQMTKTLTTNVYLKKEIHCKCMCYICNVPD